MVEKVEKHERLQDLAEIGRAHQTCDGAVRLATGAPNDRPRQARRRRLSWVCGCGVHFHFCICQMVRTTLSMDGQSKASLPQRASLKLRGAMIGGVASSYRPPRDCNRRDRKRSRRTNRDRNTL